MRPIDPEILLVTVFSNEETTNLISEQKNTEKKNTKWAMNVSMNGMANE